MTTLHQSKGGEILQISTFVPSCPNSTRIRILTSCGVDVLHGKALLVRINRRIAIGRVLGVRIAERFAIGHIASEFDIIILAKGISQASLR